MMLMRCLLGVCVLALGLFAAGCGSSGKGRPNVHPVSGTIKYKGQPVAKAQVVFTAAGSPRSAAGETNEQGAFELETFDSNDGAVAGEHVVTITKVTAQAAAGKPAHLMTPEDLTKMGPQAVQATASDAIPVKYADPKTSNLKRSVIAGEKNVFNFELTD